MIVNENNSNRISSILLGSAIAIGLSFFMDRFMIYHVMNWTELFALWIHVDIWDSFFWAYTLLAGVICFVLFLIVKTILGWLLKIRVWGRGFFLSVAVGALIYAAGSGIYEYFRAGYALDRFVFLIVMWAVVGTLCFVAFALTKDHDTYVEEEAVSDRNSYRVYYARTFYTWFIVGYFVLFTGINYMLISINGWKMATMLFALCTYAFVTLMLLFMYLSGILRKGYLLEVDNRGIKVRYGKIGFIPWGDVEGFEISASNGHDILGIRIRNEEEYLGRMSAFRKMMTRQRKFFSDSMFEIDFDVADELLPTALDEIMKRAPRTTETHWSKGQSTVDVIDHNETVQKMPADAKPVLISLVAVNVAVYLMDLLYSIPLPYFGSQSIIDALLLGPQMDMGAELFGIDTDAISHGQYYRLFTHAFLHADIMHLGLNMLALFFIGSRLLCKYSKGTVMAWYGAGIIGGGVADMVVAAITGTPIYAIGASGAIFGLLGGSLAPMVYGALWIKGKGASLRAVDRKNIFEYAAFVLVMLIPGFFEEGISWEGHLGGLLGGFIAGLVMMLFRQKKSGQL